MYNRWQPPLHELYHHGVKGMKWGVRKEYKQGSLVGNRGGLQRALNRTDRQIAVADYHSYTIHNKMTKLDRKKSRNPSKADSYDRKIDRLQRKAAVYDDISNRGYAKTKALLKDAEASGFTVSSKYSRHSIVTGKNLAVMLMSAGTIISYTELHGNKYKVKQSK